MTLPVLVINRAVDADRLAAFHQSASGNGMTPERIDALDAHRTDFPFAIYADLLGETFWGKDEIKPGAIGCFLSHRRAWQHIVERQLPMALICEDDATFLSTTRQLELAASGLPDFDIIFANGRLAAWSAAEGDYDLKRLPQVLTDLARLGGPKAAGLKPTPGADCYLVSRKGAEQLLARTETQKIHCGVDWAMVRNGLTDIPAEVARAFPELSLLQHALGVPAALEVFVLSRPVADQRDGASVLKHSVSIPLAELRAQSSTLAHVEAVSTIRFGPSVICFACRSGPDPVMEAHRSGHIWDQPGLSALLERFPPGGTFVDVGAHSGNHSVLMARMGAAATVIAIEPNEEVHRLLRTNFAINGVADRLVLHPPGTGLAAKSGQGWLLRNRKRPSESMVKAERPDELDDSMTQRVQLMPGDALLNTVPRIDAIKIDTAGSEVDVVKGLRQTLRQHRPIILIDHSAQAIERIERLAADVSYCVHTTLPSSRKNRSSSLLMPHRDDAK
ncbi:MAG: FkbM family methyltransferase [Pseudomonadota bacterium]